MQEQNKALSIDCPHPMFVQTLSNIKNYDLGNQLLDHFWTNIEFLHPIVVQWLESGSEYDRVLTSTGQNLYVEANWTDI